jgi:hypothetical protein
MDVYQEGIKVITEEFVIFVVEYLKTGIFRNKKTRAFMTAYS